MSRDLKPGKAPPFADPCDCRTCPACARRRAQARLTGETFDDVLERDFAASARRKGELVTASISVGCL